jgi:hypothetical protein
VLGLYKIFLYSTVLVLNVVGGGGSFEIYLYSPVCYSLGLFTRYSNRRFCSPIRLSEGHKIVLTLCKRMMG